MQMFLEKMGLYSKSQQLFPFATQVAWSHTALCATAIQCHCGKIAYSFTSLESRKQLINSYLLMELAGIKCGCRPQRIGRKYRQGTVFSLHAIIVGIELQTEV